MPSDPSPAPAAAATSNGAHHSSTLKDVVAAPTAISTIDGTAGRLIYRGYSIEDLANGASFEETVYLLWEGELPNASQLRAFRERLAAGRALPSVLFEHLRLVPKDAHPLVVLRSGISLLALYDPDAESMEPAKTRAKAERLLGQTATLVASWARLRRDQEPVAPRPDLRTAANLLWMLNGEEADELATHAMDVALTLHAEHEFNASTFAARVAAGTYVDIHSAVVAALATLKGPRHGGANEDVIEMIEEIGDPARAEAWTRERLARYHAASREQRADPHLRFPGMGHAVYKTLDPRAKQLRALAAQVAEARGVKGIAEIQETVRQLVTDDLHINPNVDYYSAGLYHALGIPSDLFTSIFAIARMAGYVAHIEEQLRGGRLIRPRGEYTGPPERPLVPLNER
jgi:citrate synthase